MGITEKALKANGRSRACGKCPLGLANCNETIAKVCRDAFLEGFKKGYEQKNREVKEQIDGILHPVSEPCGDNEITFSSVMYAPARISQTLKAYALLMPRIFRV